MPELDAEFHYNGHEVVIACIERGRAWHWSYVLDGTSRFELEGTGLASSDLALQEATRDAKERIDQLP